MNNEPSQLRRGKAFHKLIQQEWEQEAEGDVKSERHVRKPNGRKGRIDVFVNDDDPDSSIAIVEVKATDWDKIKKQNIRCNVRCQIRQIWSYIESQILNGQYVKDGEHKDVCPGIIFPKLPRSKERLELIEQMFEEEGIAVVWHDETREERKMRPYTHRKQDW
jgi:hypothetical protein